MQFYLKKRQHLILDPLGMQVLFWKPCSSYYRGHIWRLTLTIMNSYETISDLKICRVAILIFKDRKSRERLLHIASFLH